MWHQGGGRDRAVSRAKNYTPRVIFSILNSLSIRGSIYSEVQERKLPASEFQMISSISRRRVGVRWEHQYGVSILSSATVWNIFTNNSKYGIPHRPGT